METNKIDFKKLNDYFPLFCDSHGVLDKLSSTEREEIEMSIDLDDLYMPPVCDRIESSIVDMLHKWNAIEPQDIISQLNNNDRRNLMVAYSKAIHTNQPLQSNVLNENETLSSEGEIFLNSEEKRIEKVKELAHSTILKYDQLLEASSSEKSSLCRLLKEKGTSINIIQKAGRALEDEITLVRNTPGEKKDNDATVDPCERVYNLEVYHPKHGAENRQEFTVLSCQKLTDVFDNIYCLNDQILEEHQRHSKFVYIGQKFYIDKRVTSGCVDYTRTIRKWISEDVKRQEFYGKHEENDSPLDMNTTTFEDAPINIGEFSVYCHLGDCEHIFRVNEVRVWHPTDPSNRSAYPIMKTTRVPSRKKKCLVCKVYFAKYVCYKDRLSVSDPMLFCDHCYFAAHYTPDGHLVYSDFQTYPFYQE